MFSSKKYISILIVAMLGFCLIPSSVLSQEASRNGWVVQLNSFRDENNAERFISKFKKKGYSPFVVRGESSKWFKVRVGPYPSKDEAMQVTKDLKQNHKVSAVVVRTQKNPPVLENSGDSIDVVVSQFLIWIKAWEDREVNAYLSFYSQNLENLKISFEDWKAQRRSALSLNSGISIQVSDIEMKKNHETVEMSFVQEFKSDMVSKKGRKELTWKNEGDRWKIIKETWTPT